LGLENDNSLSICSLPEKIFCVPHYDIVAFAWPSGRHLLPFNTAGVIILSVKNYPLPVPVENESGTI
jgi:hypothetical protein